MFVFFLSASAIDGVLLSAETFLIKYDKDD